jgi:hypothetical protein
VGVTRRGVRGRRSVGCLVGVLGCLTVLSLPSVPAGAQSAGRAAGSGGTRVVVRLPPGLSESEHAALERWDAYGVHPVRLAIVGDSIALTLSMGLGVQAQERYGISVTDDATLGCDLDPQLPVVMAGTVGTATPGCTDWRRQ